MDFELAGKVGVLNGSVPAIIALMKGSGNDHVCCFVNFCSECIKWAFVIESQLADKLLGVGVLQIDGDMDKLKNLPLHVSSAQIPN